MDAILESLRASFKKGNLAAIKSRKEQLKNILRFLNECENEICDALKRDLGKSRFESITSEIGILRVEINHILVNLSGWSQKKYVSTPIAHFPASCSFSYEPKGTVLIIGPWNFPLQLTLGPLIGAVAAGNTSIIKPSEFSPNLSKLLANKLNNYIGPSYARVIEGDAQTSQELLEKKFDHIFFTGSTSVGKIVMQKAAQNLVPVTLELGGKSPCIVDKSAKISLAAKRIVWGKFLNCGQVCLAPDFVLVHKSIRDSFVSEAVKSIEQRYSKVPSRSRDYGRIVSKRHLNRLTGLLTHQNIAYGGEIDLEQRFMSPTLVVEPELDSPLMSEEIFGPILPIIQFSHFEEAIEIIESKQKPLAIYIFSDKSENIKKLYSKTASGAFVVNDTISHAAIPELPFGGVGASGMGTYHGEDSFKAFSYKRAFLKKSTLVDMPLRYPPYTKLSEKLASWFLR